MLCFVSRTAKQTQCEEIQRLPFILTLHTFTLSKGNQLLPYIHIGPLEIPTFGLLMVVAFATAYYALEGEIKRRKIQLDPYTVVAVVAFAGILGAKIWHIVDTPADRLNADTFKSFGALLSWFRGGFAWFGGFVAGIAALLIIARRNGVNMLTMLDISSFAAAVGYAVGRIGCLISGDGDYGRPTNLPWGMAFPDGLVPTTGPSGTCAIYGWPQNCAVHPTPIYEFIACVLIGWYVWRRGSRAIQHPLGPGVITGEFLVLFGIERFLVEFVRINPHVLWGMSNAQLAALLTIVAGIILLIVARRRFRKVDPVHKVLDHVVQHGNQETKPEYHRATPECPNPERWRMFDTMTAEVEVLDFLKCLMTTVKPNLVVETGTFLAVSTIYMAEGLKQNGQARSLPASRTKKSLPRPKKRLRLQASKSLSTSAANPVWRRALPGPSTCFFATRCLSCASLKSGTFCRSSIPTA